MFKMPSIRSLGGHGIDRIIWAPSSLLWECGVNAEPGGGISHRLP